MAYIAFSGLSIPLGTYELNLSGATDMRYGIDIRGGVDAVFQPADMGRKPTGEELDAARAIIETRLDQQNILDYDVTLDKQNGYILVRFPWKSGETKFDPERAMERYAGNKARYAVIQNNQQTYQSKGNCTSDNHHFKCTSA